MAENERTERKLETQTSKLHHLQVLLLLTQARLGGSTSKLVAIIFQLLSSIEKETFLVEQKHIFDDHRRTSNAIQGARCAAQTNQDVTAWSHQTSCTHTRHGRHGVLADEAV